MNLVQLKYFIEIARTQSITIAAQNLFVTQPTLSVSLKKLEESLNTKLLVRSDNIYELTKTGRLLYEQGQKILDDVNQLQIDIQQLSISSQKEKIHLGMTTLFSIQFMQEIANYMTTHPHVELVITQDGSRQLQKMLKDKLLDIALVSFPNIESDSIHIEQLTNTTTQGYNVHVVLPDTHPLASEDSLTFQQIKDEYFSSLNENFVIGEMLIKRAKDLAFKPKIVAQYDDLQVLLHSLSRSNSICLLPIEYNKVYQVPNLKWIPLDDKHNYYPIGIALHRDINQTEDILDLIKSIKSN